MSRPIWSVIRGLCDEARDDMRLNGFDQNPRGSDAIYDPEVATERTEDIVGSLVYAHDAEGNRSERTVYYPDDWYERAYGGKGHDPKSKED